MKRCIVTKKTWCNEQRIIFTEILAGASALLRYGRSHAFRYVPGGTPWPYTTEGFPSRYSSSCRIIGSFIRAFPEGLQHVPSWLCHGGHPRRRGCTTQISTLTALGPSRIQSVGNRRISIYSDFPKGKAAFVILQNGERVRDMFPFSLLRW
jgi:hypothetical protein